MPPTKKLRFTRSRQAKKITTTDHNQSSSQSSSSSSSTIKWNLQSERILSQLISLYHSGAGADGEGSSTTTTAGLLTDVILFSSDGESIPAHKIILMLSSPFFHKLFSQISNSQKNINCNPTVIVLGNVNTSQLRNLIRLIYTSQCVIPSNELEEFHQVAVHFGVEGLVTSSSSPSSSSPKSQSKPQTSHSHQSQSDVIKVHIIDQRRQPEQDNQLNQGQDSSVEVTATQPCKTEPSEDSHPDDGADDHLSNFSDDVSHQGDDDDEDNDDDDLSTSYAPPKTRPSISSSAATAPSRKGVNTWLKMEPPPTPSRKGVNTWLKMEPPPTPSQLKSDWRIPGRYKYATFTGHQYYCAQGHRQSCPTEIKSKTLPDNTIFWFKNDKPHDNHKPPDYQFGLTEQQKNFVVKCLESGVVMPKDIFLKMETEGIEKPSRIKLAGMLQRYRKKNPDKIWKRLPSSSKGSTTRRIRKFSSKNGPQNCSPKKRGRPPLAKDGASSSRSTILSSTTGHLYQTGQHHPHPNHYPSQAAQLTFPPFTAAATTSSLHNPSTSAFQQQHHHPTYPYLNF